MMEEHPMESLDISEYRICHSVQRHGSATFAKPKEIGAFTIDGQRKFRNDSSQLAYLEDSVNLHKRMDLNDGYSDRFLKRDENIKERLDHLLRWFIFNLHKFEKEGDEHGTAKQSMGKLPGFILWRGHMTKIMCTPYENQEGWEMAAQKIGSTIYISEVETTEAESKRLNQNEKQKLMTYWGVRFEKYMTRPDPPPSKNSAKVSRTSPVDQKTVKVNTNEAYCTVLRSQINSHDVIYSAEVDCCCHPDRELSPPDNYIELKTSREFSVPKQEDSFFRYKAKKWWAQSFLAGVPWITCGFRDDDGIVVRLKDFRVLDLPHMAGRVRGNTWDANVCLRFLNEFLNFVKKSFAEIEQDSVLIFTWAACEKKISCKRYNMPTNHAFLPEWYTTCLK